MKAFWVQISTSFPDISRDVTMATDFVKKMANSALIVLAFRNGMGCMHDLIAPLMPLYPVKFW